MIKMVEYLRNLELNQLTPAEKAARHAAWNSKSK
jgi:hypothetical protein